MKIIVVTPLDCSGRSSDVVKEYVRSLFASNEKFISVFLSGGCTTDWREVVKSILNAKFKNNESSMNIVVFDPKTNLSAIAEPDLRCWEISALHASDLVLFNFEGSSSSQPGTLFELKERLSSKSDTSEIIINCHPDYPGVKIVADEAKISDLEVSHISTPTSLGYGLVQKLEEMLKSISES